MAHAASLMRLVIFLKELNSLLMDRIDLLSKSKPAEPANQQLHTPEPTHPIPPSLIPTSGFGRIFHNSIVRSPVSLCQRKGEEP